MPDEFHWAVFGKFNSDSQGVVLLVMIVVLTLGHGQLEIYAACPEIRQAGADRLAGLRWLLPNLLFSH